ncbi:hypothetical protein [Naasia sp. SYSU D00057]|uniref:hypothetical protein n=1 Tax=Naasia sp. SYSU D00057 TaxID=2817380 RepID=UPI001B308BF7|nr:hypothetical protein [Naasia sp. SYSU D00057]
MNDPHIAEVCSAPLDQIAELTVDDASLDFGEGALMLTCICGSWAVEDSSGAVVAWSQSVEVAVTQLAGAA